MARCMKCGEDVVGQLDFNVVTNVADEVVGVLCGPHHDIYVGLIEESDIPADFALAIVMLKEEVS